MKDRSANLLEICGFVRRDAMKGHRNDGRASVFDGLHGRDPSPQGPAVGDAGRHMAEEVPMAVADNLVTFVG